MSNTDNSGARSAADELRADIPCVARALDVWLEKTSLWLVQAKKALDSGKITEEQLRALAEEFESQNDALFSKYDEPMRYLSAVRGEE